MKYFNKRALTLGLMLFATASAFAQSETTAEAVANSRIPDEVLWLFIASYSLIAIAFVVMAAIVLMLVRTVRRKSLEEQGIIVEDKPFFSWKRFNKRMTDAVPIEDEEEIMFEHEFDGIRELDNNLPPWWTGMFYATIFIGIVYFSYFHVLGGPSSTEEYEMAMAEAEAEVAAYRAQMADLVDENNVAMLDDETSIAAGKQIFLENCQACHGEWGEGREGLGPNLTDAYWLHGGDIKSVFKTIKYGIQGKNMVSWEKQIPPAEMQKVSSFVMTLQGTDPPNPKAPEGELYVPEGEEATADSTEVEGEVEDDAEDATEEETDEEAVEETE